jgi:FSR family fosmidomycin resistance protein-like MFS transporter
MNDSSQTISRQWVVLLALTAGHFIVDCFPGMMHTLLPEVQRDFGFTLSSGASLLTVFLIGSNAIQVLIGHLRPDKTRPLFMYMGLLCSMCIGIFVLLPRTSGAFWPAAVILLICGSGVGMTHPEFLRSVHTLDGISSAVSTSVFMGGGVAGFAFGGWTATVLVQRWGFPTLWYFCGAAVVIGIVLASLRVRLAEEKQPIDDTNAQGGAAVPFWPLFIMTALGGSSSSVLVWAVPQTLDKMGFALTFGGFSVMLFSLAGGLGGILMSRWAARKGELITCLGMLAVGVPFGFFYSAATQYRWGAVLLGLTGLLCYGAYPLMVSMARQAEGGNLGRRMGLIVGGTWLIASFVPRLLAPVAQKIGLHPILMIAPLGYLAAAALAAYLWLKIKRASCK